MTVPGSILQGRYQINEQLGQGGMGTVFKARDLRLNKIVAIKSSKFTEDKLRRQFELEAQLLGVLRHPSLPIVSDHFEEDKELFLVMDYIDGVDLGEVIASDQKPFPLDDVLRWADQLLDALDFMHTQVPPIIHRDIKPRNLKLSGKGRIILLDFGLAKGSPSPEVKATTTGSIFGYTPQYASLEQRQGTGTDARSDLYSLGATLYHLLSSKMPVDASTRAAAIINGEVDPLPPLHSQNPNVPPPVSGVIHQAMSLKREGRPASAAEMREQLQVAASGAGAVPADAVETIRMEEGAQGIVGLPGPSLESVVTAVRPGHERAAENLTPPEPPVVKGPPTPSKLDHAFYGGLALGGLSALVIIASLALGLGTFGVMLWLVSLALTGAVVTLSYVMRARVPTSPADVLKLGAVAGVVSAVVQWLLLVLAYFADVLTVDLGNARALLLLVGLLGLLGCVSPISAFIAARLPAPRGPK